MICPNCSKDLVLDGEIYHSDIELDGTSSAVGTVTITVCCEDCLHELGEYNIELEQDITEWAEAHQDEEEHELSVDLDDEVFATTDVGKVGHAGACATIKLSCSCGSEVQYLWANYESPDEIMKWVSS